MSKVILTKEKLDSLANTIAYKSGVPVTMTIDEMNAAVESIKFPKGTLNVTENGTHNVYDYENVKVDVPEAELTSLDVYPSAELDMICYPDFKKTLLNAYDCGDFVSNNQITLPIQFEEKVKYGIGLNLYIGTDSGEISGYTTGAPHVFGSTVYLDIDEYRSNQSIYDIIDDIIVSKDGLLTVSFNTVPNYCNGTVWIGEVYDGFSDVFVGRAQLMSQTVTPSQEQQTITPTAGAIGLSEVIVEPIPDEFLIPNLTELTVTATEETQVIEPMPLVGTMKGTFDGNKSYTQFSFLNNCLNHKLTVSGTIGTNVYEINKTINSFNDDRIYFGDNNAYYIYFDSKDGEISLRNLDYVTNIPVDLSFYSGDYDGYSKVTVNPIPSQYIVPSGQQTINVNGTYDVTDKSQVVVDVDPIAIVTDTEDTHGGIVRDISVVGVVKLQNKTISANSGTKIVKPDIGYNGFSEVAIIGSKEVKALNFMDYDGRNIVSYTYEEAQALTALPENPSHIGLVSQGWNWSLANIKSYLTKYPDGIVNVGQMYITESGATEIDIVLDDSNYLSPYLSICPNGTVTIDWGDGSISDTLTGTSTKSLRYIQHVYANTGNYTITIDGNVGFYSATTSDVGLLSYRDSSTNKRIYSQCVVSIRCGSNVSINDAAFNYCINLQSISIPVEVVSIGESAFNSCNALQNVTIPKNITLINRYLFSGCKGLQSISIPDGVTSIRSGAFRYCCALQSITIPDGATSIEENTFNNCYTLQSITIPDSVMSIGNNAFYSCYALQSITIPDGVTSIGNSAFSYCYALQSITIPDSVTSIGSSAFWLCTSLRSIVLPNRINSIGDNVFGDCARLSSIAIPNGVTSIGTNAFSGCSTLRNIIIPDGVTNIGNMAFANNSSMMEIHFLSNTPASLGINVFRDLNDAIIYVPKGSLEAYQTATNWSNYASYMREEES